MVDTHCHLTHPRLAGELAAIVARARQAGVTACMTIGTGIDDARAARDLATGFPGFVFCAAGIDPFTAHRLGQGFDEEFHGLESELATGSYVALGEVGLDYHYDLDSPALQAERLERQLDLAARRELPVVIHVREAHQDMIALLRRHPGNRGVIHSFTAGPAEAERYLALGWHLAFNGVVTFTNAAAVREALKLVPHDRLLVETDSPYLAPVPHRGKRCEPALVRHTFERIAALRGETFDELVRSTTGNFATLLRLEQGTGRLPN